jgi:hypothetical protein
LKAEAEAAREKIEEMKAEKETFLCRQWNFQKWRKIFWLKQLVNFSRSR